MLSLFVVAAYYRGESFVAISWLPTNKVLLVLVLVLFGSMLALGFYCILLKFPRYFLEAQERPDGRVGKHIVFTKQGIIFCTLIIFFCWMPITILMYPAVTNMDFFNQIYQYQASAPTYYTTLHYVVDAEFIDHHPIFDTLVFGWFYTLGDSIGSQNVGLFLLTLCESFFTAFVLALACCYSERLGIPSAIRVAFLLFAIFWPYYAPLAASSTKDTLFTIAFIPFMLCYFEVFRSKGSALQNPWFSVVFIIVTGLCILTKKLGIYICVPSLLFLFFLFKPVRKQIVAITSCTIVIFALLIPQVLFHTLDVAPGGKQEMYFIPLQQTVSLLKEYPDEYSDDEKDVINKVVDLEKALEDYSPTLADGVKNTFRPNANKDDLRDYLALWAKKGLRHPGSYIKATLMCSARLVLPSTSMGFEIDITDKTIRERWTKYFTETSQGFNFNAERPEGLLNIASSLNDFLSVTIAGIPVVGLFTTKGMYGGWIPFICISFTLFNRKKDAFALVPIILSVLLLLISPGSLARYVHCLLFLVIPMVAWAMYSFREEKV